MEKRQFPRFKTQGLNAVLTFYQANSNEQLVLKGEVLDMSLTGIKIKLFTALPAGLNDSKINIALRSAHSKVPMNINGVIRHSAASLQCGMQFAQEMPKQAADDLLFECTRIQT